VLAIDKYKTGYAEEGIEECADLERIYSEADIISFHLPLTEETRHYFNNIFLEGMQRPFVLLNLSRGGIVSQQSLFNGLKSGKIKGAALDVWETEPVEKMEDEMKAMYKELITMPNFIGTPHIGGYTVQALYKMSYFLIRKIKNAVH
jgi:D-3-phosphoglycerate dehydrogenase